MGAILAPLGRISCHCSCPGEPASHENPPLPPEGVEKSIFHPHPVPRQGGGKFSLDFNIFPLSPCGRGEGKGEYLIFSQLPFLKGRSGGLRRISLLSGVEQLFLFRIAPRLPPEVFFPVAGFEKSPDGTVGVTGQESPALPVEAGDDPVFTDGLQNIPSCGPVPELLGQPQIFFLGYFSEFPAMLPVMIIEFLRRGKTDLRAGDGRPNL